MLKTIRLVARPRTLLLTTAILAVSAATALAANISGDGTLIGTTGADNITAGNGNDTVWGLGGADNITAGNGNDMIDGNGKCQAGVHSGDYGNGLPNGQYCEHGYTSTASDNITAGKGDDTVYGGGGHNNITVGGGDDTIYGGPLGDTIVAGPAKNQGDDAIYLDYNNPRNVSGTYTGSTVTVAWGNDVVHAQNGVKDTINCPKGNQTTVYADKSDVTTGCFKVIYAADTAAAALRRAATTRATHKRATHKATHKRATHKRATHKRTHKRTHRTSTKLLQRA